MHSRLNLPGRHEFSRGGRAVAATANDIMHLGDLPASAPADVAIVYDYEAHGVARADQRAQNQRLDAGDLMLALILPLHLCVDPCPYASEWRPAKT